MVLMLDKMALSYKQLMVGLHLLKMGKIFKGNRFCFIPGLPQPIYSNKHRISDCGIRICYNKIYDIWGKEVVILVNEEKLAGGF
jgi:hypothetical protein